MGLNGNEEGEEANIFTRDRAPTRNQKRVRQAVVLGIVLVVLALVWGYLQGGENRALNALSPAQREALFMETFDSFRLMCLADAGPKLLMRCQKQAEFLMRFSECDEACRQELAPALRNAVR
ncbi:hypothetical protein MYSTI_00161 [Myxococcus stipitatus DSM 14675]|uniref:Uncharacterized protein n=1 Tax=Myxococcus stipitatus (strain DSM 14675 / JCM 12634 / Mx s8) TaxID=1278073 RepID=L7U0Y0_MYXSD|nr:hypothetical protein [Myxococcus stipitatus]AGC41520.1 hypothetical protein MYSTI_00161 [Myxococcus stipitatus DSM 14675]